MKYEWRGMRFDWDENKNLSNIDKHGRAFTDSHLVWMVPFGILLAGNSPSEIRLVRRGVIEDQVWLCVYVMRDEMFRVVSLRPASNKERNIP